MSFGGETIDNFGVVRDFPAVSMLTGLIANAFGWRRGDTDRLDRLQDRLVFAVRIDRPSVRIQDYQTARLLASDKGWTTFGRPEGRNSDSPSYKIDNDYLRRSRKSVKALTHQRYRDYDADGPVRVALCLEPPDEEPSLDAVAGALDSPARPLFFGRKPCLPSARVLAGDVVAPSALEALRRLPSQLAGDRAEPAMRVFWPRGEGELERQRDFAVTDRRNWRSGVHGGSRAIAEGEIAPPDAGEEGRSG